MAGLERLWEAAGGAPAKAALMAAISIAESSGNSGAVSPVGAIGLWQVMPFWAPHFGLPVSALYIALTNARVAKGISGDGNHVGAWDTCYNPPASAARRLDLTWPEQGSPAWNILGGRGGGGGGGVVVVSHTGPSAADSALARKVGWANHLQTVAIPNNTRWVSFNRTLHPHTRPTRMQ